MKPEHIDISLYDYDLPDERIAKFPLPDRDASKLLVWKDGEISQSVFSSIGEVLPNCSMLIFNNTKVIRARILMRKETGALIEIFCLEPHDPAGHERSLASTGMCEWICIIGNSKKWKQGELTLHFTHEGHEYTMTARREGNDPEGRRVSFRWDAPLAFGQLLEILGRMPIPPYLGRDSQKSDNTRYQTVYSRTEGSVAAPTAGLHFTRPLLERLGRKGIALAEVTLHVGAGTFLPVKTDDASRHVMHTEHFTVTSRAIRNLLAHKGKRIAVGTTTVRTLESLCILGYRVISSGDPSAEDPVGQWEGYSVPGHYTGPDLLTALADYLDNSGLVRIQASTGIMIAPGYRFRIVDGIVTNFHQPKSTLLLLVSAFTGEERWREIYSHALSNGFRFLSYGDSSILLR
ncbi:MAG: S-adenosylmethionine:tRNA ribosyltransferase-isomerase [Rikenellaceae bacterium]|nr:S-adenosylmethionine:tRNA ribosyltransferase-isomerase [Rikenellaceae bacterium]